MYNFLFYLIGDKLKYLSLSTSSYNLMAEKKRALPACENYLLFLNKPKPLYTFEFGTKTKSLNFQ